jgi:hypothetical protein
VIGSSNWISVGALGAAFERDPHLMPESTGLAGRTLVLHFENAWVIEHRFVSATLVKRTVRDKGVGGEPPLEGAVTYAATEVRPGIYFVSCVEPGRRATTSTLLLDVSAGICTLVLGQLPAALDTRKSFLERIHAREELTGVGATFLRGTIDVPYLQTSPRHEATTDLIGKRVEYTYSPTERYEHIYLNERYYTWHCLAGSEQGLADTDRCHYLKLADRLYLFVWREKIVPTLGIVAVDFRQMKTTGRILGYREFDFGSVTHFSVGARARVVSGA